MLERDIHAPRKESRFVSSKEKSVKRMYPHAARSFPNSGQSVDKKEKVKGTKPKIVFFFFLFQLLKTSATQ